MVVNVLGFVDVDGCGYVGMEKVYNKCLMDCNMCGIFVVLLIDVCV